MFFGGQITTSEFTDDIISLDETKGAWSKTGHKLGDKRGFSKIVPINDNEVLVVGGYVKIDVIDPLTGAKNAAPSPLVERFYIAK